MTNATENMTQRRGEKKVNINSIREYELNNCADIMLSINLIEAVQRKRGGKMMTTLRNVCVAVPCSFSICGRCRQMYMEQQINTIYCKTDFHRHKTVNT